MSAPMSHDVFVGLVAEALAAARFAASGLRDTVIPAWPPARRTFPEHLARRLERAEIFEERVVADLDTFLDLLSARIEHGTRIGWEADENHGRGGYEIVCQDEETAALSRCASNLRAARKSILVALQAASAIRLASELLDA